MRFDIKVNADSVIQELTQHVPARIIKEIRETALLETSAQIVADAKALVPVDTYALKQSIRARWSSKNKLMRQISAVGGAGGRAYALPVEYGRKALGRRDAQPFMRPALYKNRELFRSKTIAACIAAIQRKGQAV